MSPKSPSAPDVSGDPEVRHHHGWIADSAGVGVGASAVVLDERGRLLLVQAGYGRGREKWLIPNGALQAGETWEQTALGELREETGLEGEVVGLLAVRNWTGGRFTDLNAFFLVQARGRPLAQKGEILDARFFGPQEVEALTAEGRILPPSLAVARRVFGSQEGLLRRLDCDPPEAEARWTWFFLT